MGGAPDESYATAMEKSSSYPRYRLPLDQLVTYVGGSQGEGEEGEGHREKLTERLHHQLTTIEDTPSLKEKPTMKKNEKKETAKNAKATCAPKVVGDNDIDEDKEAAGFSYIRTASDVTMDIKGSLLIYPLILSFSDPTKVYTNPTSTQSHSFLSHPHPHDPIQSYL